MKVSSYYGSVYLSGIDVGNKTFRLQVASVNVERFDESDKLIVAFENAKKSLVLNKTNASALVAAWSDDCDAWRGRWLEAFTVPTQFNGRTYDAIRVRPLAETATLVPTTGNGAATVAGLPAESMPAGGPPPSDDIPF